MNDGLIAAILAEAGDDFRPPSVISEGRARHLSRE
jgi:hypothetical protein